MQDAVTEGRTPWQGILSQFNFANFLTFLRGVMPLPVYWFAFFEMWDWAVYAIIFAAITDAEGTWARLTGTTTPLGWAFDPIADKIFTNLVLVGAVTMSGDIWVLLLWSVMFGYDLDNTIRRWPAILKACLGQEPASSTPVTIVSKGKTVLLFLVMIVLYAPHEWGLVEHTRWLVLFTLGVLVYSWAHNRRSMLSRAWHQTL